MPLPPSLLPSINRLGSGRTSAESSDNNNNTARGGTCSMQTSDGRGWQEMCVHLNVIPFGSSSFSLWQGGSAEAEGKIRERPPERTPSGCATPFGPLMLLQMRRKQIGSIVSHGRDDSTTCRFQIQTWTAGTSTRVSCITCLMSIFISSHRRHGRPEFLGRSVVTGCLSAPLPLSASITLGRMRPPTDNL